MLFMKFDNHVQACKTHTLFIMKFDNHVQACKTHTFFFNEIQQSLT